MDIHKTNSVDHPFPRARPFKKGNNKSTARKLGPLACAITFAVPALAQDGTPVDPSDIDAVTRMSNAVADTVVENVQSFEIWDDGDTPRLLLVARQEGLSSRVAVLVPVATGSMNPTDAASTTGKRKLTGSVPTASAAAPATGRNSAAMAVLPASSPT